MAQRLGSGTEGYLRVMAMSIAFYDALWTLPAEFRMYRDQKSFKKISRSCILLILIRYISILVIVVGSVGFFYNGFTESSCHKFYLLAPSFKVVQTMISQLIVALRTIAVTRKTRWVVWFVPIIFVITVAAEFFSNLFARLPFREPVNAIHANCTSGNASGLKLVWIHYLAAMLYDGTCVAIATAFIYAESRKVPNHSLDSLTRLLFREGVLYFIYLTVANMLNLFLYLLTSTEAQSAGATLGYALTWIMSQRLLIHLHEFKSNLRIRDPLPPNQFKSSFYIAQHHRTDNHNHPTTVQDELELGVHVNIEENVKVDYDKEISGGVLSPHRITTARIEREHRKAEGMRRAEDDNESQATCAAGTGSVGKGWQVI